MSQLILSWLNDEVQLSKKITNFEYDFSNGFFFGELLSLKNQQLNFDKFKNSNKRSARLSNWQYLKPTFTSLGIKLSPLVCNEIMQRKRGVSLNYLYKLKMALEKVKNPTDMAIFDKKGSYPTRTEIKIIKPARVQYDKMENTFFQRRLNETNKAQKQINQEEHLRPFTDAQKGIDDQVRRDYEEAQNRREQQKQERRSNQLNELQRAQAFREDWEQKGFENYKKNQKVKYTRLKMVQKFKEVQKKKRIRNQTRRKNEYQKEVYDGIDKFEQNLYKFGITQKGEVKSKEQNEFEKSQQKKSKGGLTFKLESTIEKIRKRKRERDTQAKERDKRRRKMIVDQNNSQRNFEIKKRQQMLIEKLQQHSKQEKEIQYEIWRAMQCQEIINQNRILRENKYQQKREILNMNSKSKAEKQSEIFFNEYQDVLIQKQLLQRELEIEFKQKTRKTNYDFINDLVKGVSDITEACYQDQQNQDSTDISKEFWDQCIDLFLSNNKIVKTPQLAKKVNDKANTEVSASEQLLSNKEFEQYLSGTGEWKPTHNIQYKEDDETPVEERIAQKLENNFYLGDLIELVIDLEHPPQKSDHQKTTNPNWFPLRLSLLGYSFAGKKTLAKLVEDKYGLEIMSVEELINECIDVSQSQEVEEQALDEDYYGYIENQKRRQTREALLKDDEFKQLGQRILENIQNGKEIPNDIYLKLILHKIKRTYPNMTEEEFVNTYFEKETYNPDKETQNTTESKDEAQVVRTKKERDYNEIMKSEFTFSKGWMLLDYPLNYLQAQELEKGLTGFLTQDDRTVPEGEILKQQAAVLAKSTPKQLGSNNLLESGLDCVAVVEVPKDDCLKRAFGRRIDPENNDLYHLDESPPQTDDSSKVERLQCLDDPYNSELSIMDKHCSFDDNRQLMQTWYDQFGFQDINFKTWNTFDGMGERFEVFKRLDQLITTVLKHKYTLAKKIKEGIEQREAAALAEEERKRQEAEEASKVRPIENDQLESMVKEFKAPSEVVYKINSYTSKNILNRWESCRKFYISNIKKIFKASKNQKNLITSYFAEIQRKYISILQRTNGKSIHLLNYQQEFNSFVEKYPDLIEDEQAKDELHQRVDDLHDKLWDIMDVKKSEADNERKSIMESGWVNGQIVNYINNMKNLMRIEVLTYWSTLKILQDFYNYSMGKELPPAPELNFEEYDQDLSELELIEREEDSKVPTFPKIDTIYEEAQKLLKQEAEEVQDQKQQKGKGKKPPAKKGKGKVQAKDLEEEEEVVSPLEEEMKKAIQLERQNIRYKLYMIMNVTKTRINSLLTKSEDVYARLEDWLNYNMKVENEAVEKIAMIFRDHIEDHEPIQKELRIEVIDIIESYKYLNFATPPTVKIPAKESFRSDRFSILQLYKISEELKSLQNNSGILENNIFLEFMDRRLKNNISGGYFPQIFADLTKENILKLISRLDPLGHGYISVKDFFTYLCLLQSSIMNENRREFYTKHVLQFTSDDNIDLTIFLNCPAWFDVTENQMIVPNQEQFDRPKQIKQLLFAIHKNEETGLMSMDSYLRSLSVIDYNKKGRVFGQFDTYYQFLFN